MGDPAGEVALPLIYTAPKTRLCRSFQVKISPPTLSTYYHGCQRTASILK